MQQILVVDDEKPICDLVKSVLAATECQIDTSTDPIIALDMCGKKEYDLVITDVNMPSMTGLELRKSVLAMNEQQHPTFIFMTGSAPEGVVSELNSINAYEIISKPFNINLMIDAVTRALRFRGASQASGV